MGSMRSVVKRLCLEQDLATCEEHYIDYLPLVCLNFDGPSPVRLVLFSRIHVR
jgi:hypothetical protein